MLDVFTVSLVSVLRVLLVCAAGGWLARRGLMTRDLRTCLGRVVVLLMLPCFLFVNVGARTTLDSLCEWGMLPAFGLIYAAAGLLVGHALVALMRPAEPLRRPMAVATAFGNSGYIPIPLVTSVAATAALFAGDPEAARRGVTFISLYLVGFSPCLWGIAYPYLAGAPTRKAARRHLLSPPILSVLAGILVGVVPWLRGLLIGPGAPLALLTDTADLVGQATIPCALLLLGANLTDPDTQEAHLRTRDVIGVACGKLAVMPLFGCLLTVVCWKRGLIPHDPMFGLVLMLEAAVPPATNLIVMCQAHGKGEAAMSRLLVWSYIAAVPGLTVLVALFLHVLGSL